MRERDEQEFREFVVGRSHALRRTAYLLCGDWHHAEDVVQTALTKLYVAWRRVRDPGNLDSYVRQIVVRTCLDERRRGWRRESPSAEVPDRLAAGGPGGDFGYEERTVLLDALRQIPPRQRAVLVLRFWEDLSVEHTAQLLGCSAGTVKSQSARGLDTLRTIMLSHSVDLLLRETEGNLS